MGVPDVVGKVAVLVGSSASDSTAGETVILDDGFLLALQMRRVNYWLNVLQDFLQQGLHAGGSCYHKKSTAHNAQDTGNFVPWSHNIHFPILFGPYRF